MATIRVTAADMRAKYNQMQIDQRLANGQLKAIETDRRPGGSNSGQPPGTDTVIEQIVTHDQKFVAVTHRFDRPDGTTTRRDPKSLSVGRDRWLLKR